jgi:hypothetical protein
MDVLSSWCLREGRGAAGLQLDGRRFGDDCVAAAPAPQLEQDTDDDGS